MVNPFVLVGIGGILGAISRHLVGEVLPDRFGLHTFSVNVVGSFALGVLVVAPIDDGTLLIFGTGFCGAFTTFSTFAVETVRLYERGQRRAALVSASANLFGALLGVGLGAVVVELLVRTV